MNFRPESSSVSAERAYWFTKVSVASRIEAFVSLISGGICLMCSGEGYWNAFMPVRIGSSTPAVSPKQWNVGKGLKNTQSGFSGMWAATCRQLATRFSWVSTTPLGAPKLPDVNRITPASVGRLAARNRLGKAPAAAANSLSARPMEARTSSR